MSAVTVLARLKVPASEPVLVMSTVPLAVSPGFRLAPVKIAAPSLLLVCENVPAVTMLPGFAVLDVKSAPDPIVTAAARPMVPRPSRRAPGDVRHSAVMRFMRAPG